MALCVASIPRTSSEKPPEQSSEDASSERLIFLPLTQEQVSPETELVALIFWIVLSPSSTEKH